MCNSSKTEQDNDHTSLATKTTIDRYDRLANNG